PRDAGASPSRCHPRSCAARPGSTACPWTHACCPSFHSLVRETGGTRGIPPVRVTLKPTPRGARCPASAEPIPRSGVAALVARGARRHIVQAVLLDRLGDDRAVDLALVGEHLQRLDDHRGAVDLEEAAGRRACVTEAESVG